LTLITALTFSLLLSLPPQNSAIWYSLFSNPAISPFKLNFPPSQFALVSFSFPSIGAPSLLRAPNSIRAAHRSDWYTGFWTPELTLVILRLIPDSNLAHKTSWPICLRLLRSQAPHTSRRRRRLSFNHPLKTSLYYSLEFISSVLDSILYFYSFH